MNMKMKKPERSTAGQIVDKDGNVLGDEQFHEMGWNSTPEAVLKDAEAMDDVNAELAEQQAESYSDPETRRRAFAGLVEIFPEHPNVEAWRKKAAA